MPPRLAFFPDPYFAWTFYVVLVGLSLLASYIDLSKAVVPKSLTLTMLALGLVFNVVRGAWLGGWMRQPEQPVWRLAGGSAWLGGLDGLLFALTGCGVVFALFTVLWALKLCGGGDVKLFAALGAWVGVWYVAWIMLASVGVLTIMLVGRIFIERGARKGKRRMTYASPVAVGTAVVLLWFFRVDLHLVPADTTIASQLPADGR